MHAIDEHMYAVQSKIVLVQSNLNCLLHPQGIRTVISTNSEATASIQAEAAQNNETWVYYPDDSPARSFYKGDSRAALAPFLAHRELGDTYKWMLYGDDDTQFFLDGALRLAQDFDPDLPWFITGASPASQLCCTF